MTILIDCEYQRPEFAASYLLVDGNRAAFVENNTVHSVPILLEKLAKAGLKPTDVELVLITHVHLDHAGGSAALMKACPNATLLAHPRAVPHVVDPSKLVASARQVYGDAKFERLYGEIEPIPASRVRAVEDGETVRLGNRTLQFLHVRGHANHHYVVYDASERTVYTGDAFGVAYPVMQKAGRFIFPSTSPTDFDAVLAKQAVDRIVDTGAKRAYLTHYGPVDDLAECASQLHSHLDFAGLVLEEAIRSEVADEHLEAFCNARLRPDFERRVAARGLEFDADLRDLCELDLGINAAGLAHVARKRRAAEKADWR